MIYLDHNATTPILPEVLEAMMPYLATEWSNPSSSYKFGSKLKEAGEKWVWLGYRTVFSLDTGEASFHT